MREQQPMTQTVKATEARQDWYRLIERVYRGGPRVLVEKSGIPMAAVVSPQELERLSELDSIEEAGWDAVDRIRERNADADPDEVLADVTAEVEAVRRERYERKHAAKSGH